MCGIAGIWSSKDSSNNKHELELMKTAIKHRGPDGHGSWFSEDKSLALGHQRLAIIDLSEKGAQPMEFENEFVITYNGEIYNYIELREKLKSKGFTFTSESDTEVILKSYKVWGIKMLDHFDGMFAFALYDRNKEELFVARDRFGEKPFYYANFNGKLYFASEIKGLFAGGVPKTVNYNLLHNFFVNDLVENPNDQRDTFFNNIYKLKPGHFSIITKDLILEQKKYWQIDLNKTSTLSFQEATGRFKELLSLSLKRRLRSDVPVGTSLSGGLDSSTIVGLVSLENKNPQTFSARFPNFSKDEGYFINLMQQQFNTKHHDVIVDEEALIGQLDSLVKCQDEPFQSGSIFAQYAVYEAASKNNVTVMLDGQGADEFLCGYHKDFKFFYRELIKKKQENLKIMKLLKENHGFTPNNSMKESFHIKFPRAFDFLRSNFSGMLNKELPTGITRGFDKNYASDKSLFYDPLSLKEMLKHEMSNQGLEKLLRFADRNAMAHAVEVRLPFLYHELVQFVLSLPSEYLLNEGWSKALLRNSAKDFLPKEIVYRKDKVGFEAPHKKWVESNALQDEMNNAKSYFIKENIITADYASDWKVLIAYKTMFE